MTDEKLIAVEDDGRIANGGGNDDYDDVLTAEELVQIGFCSPQGQFRLCM